MKSNFINANVKNKYILKDFILYITCMSKGIAGFIKLTLSPTFSRFFTNSLYCHCSNNSSFFTFLRPDAAYILETP